MDYNLILRGTVTYRNALWEGLDISSESALSVIAKSDDVDALHCIEQQEIFACFLFLHFSE